MWVYLATNYRKVQIIKFFSTMVIIREVFLYFAVQECHIDVSYKKSESSSKLKKKKRARGKLLKLI